MKRIAVKIGCLAAMLALVCGCGANYGWRSAVPSHLRSVYVPTFRNESLVMEAGSVATRQLLREFQREGTFRIATDDEAALEVQGTIGSVQMSQTFYDRRSGLRINSAGMTMVATVSVIDRSRGALVIDNRQYRGQATYSLYQDNTTSMRDASGRAAEEIAAHIVDDIRNLRWDVQQKGGK